MVIVVVLVVVVLFVAAICVDLCFYVGGVVRPARFRFPYRFPLLSIGGNYGSSSFSPSRSFKLSDPIWRRRWVRRRVPCRPQAALGTDSVPTSVKDSVQESVKDLMETSLKDSGRAGGSGPGKMSMPCRFVCSVRVIAPSRPVLRWPRSQCCCGFGGSRSPCLCCFGGLAALFDCCAIRNSFFCSCFCRRISNLNVRDRQLVGGFLPHIPLC